jgi:Arc/MetJ family transcription regulator
MKRTNVVVDEKLMAEAQRLTGIRTLRDLLDAGLRELVARERRKHILTLRGEMKWEGDLDAWRRDK